MPASGGPFRAIDSVRLVRAERGFHTVIAGMTLPNDASVGLRRAMGFEPGGTYRRIGWKHDNWHEVGWVQRTIRAGPDPPAEPR